ncbi:MAG: polyphosphate polymerase domain-containing protein [Brumimicrobium sp.]|nr:polyphosphate polymerase domain-containing protein [Brumimicrobium sp.]
MEKVKEVLSDFDVISLEEMDTAGLMDRIDTKFAFHIGILPEILKELVKDYRVLEVQGKRISSYESLYFDKSAFDFYKDHHNKKNHRFKIRFRKYADNDLYFLEVKEKIKGRTKKKRIPVQKFEYDLSQNSKDFIHKFVADQENLEPKLWNTYKRITLVSQDKKERLTLDTDLKFEWKNEARQYPQLVIAELKQEKLDRGSIFYRMMRSKGMRPYRLSKYCIGAIELYSEKELKYNRFKKKLLKLKLINDAT